MGVFHVLTVILVLLKIFAFLEISWWWALAPSIIALSLPVFVIVVTLTAITFAALWSMK